MFHYIPKRTYEIFKDRKFIGAVIRNGKEAKKEGSIKYNLKQKEITVILK